MLYRLFPMSPGAAPFEPGGPLFVPRLDQGAGRHDNPELFGAMYFSRHVASPVAELLQSLLGQTMEAIHLLFEGAPRGLVAVEDEALGPLVDLDNPRDLSARSLRPSGVATHYRPTTQGIAAAVWEEGAKGFEWWSTIESSWTNVTLFQERSADRLHLVGDPELLTIEHPAVIEAAEVVGLELPD